MLSPAVGVAGLPEDWAAQGWLQAYDAFRDPAGWGGHGMLVLRSRATLEDGAWAAIETRFLANRYRGKRIRYSAEARSEGATGWAGLWMRVESTSHGAHPSDSQGPPRLPEQSLKGTTAWARYEVVMDVPASAEAIDVGCLIEGPGALFCAAPKIQEVSAEVPVTHGPVRTLRVEPQLDLER